MTYDLARMTRQKGVRRSQVIIRSIEVTRTLEADLYAITRVPVDAWASMCRDRILPAYERALSDLIMDAPDGDLRLILDEAAAEVAAVTSSTSVIRSLEDWLTRVVGWHAKAWAARVISAVGVDVYPFIDLRANDTEIRAFRQWIADLITSINDKLRDDIQNVVWQGFLNRTPRRQIARELTARIGIGRRRAQLIASDQANKVAAKLTQIRQEEAGIRRFSWQTARDDRVRASHAELQGRIFEWRKPPSIGLPGTPIRCRCTGAAVLDLE